jgi:uncharacterized protein YjbI with pentapeptide repeats
MANPEHLEILKQGMEVWKKADLREANLNNINLSKTCLSHANLSFANLSFVNLYNADLSHSDLGHANMDIASLNKANLSHAFLGSASLRQATLNRAALKGANLREADLSNSYLEDSDLSGANLRRSNLRGASFKGSNLSEAALIEANLLAADLSHADFTRAETGLTVFAGNNLSTVKGLETIEHWGPSAIATDTLYKSSGRIPDLFLRGCGFSDWEIDTTKLYRPDLSNEEITNILYRIHDLRAHQAIQINPLFISYNHADSPFIDEIEGYLNNKGIRFWRDIHHATAGRLETQIDRAIRLNSTVLLVLSQHSVDSDWVQHEARLARKLELETKRDVLCPVALDDTWKDCHWPERLREQIMEYNILDFSDWKNEDTFRHMFGRLLDGLDLFYK